MNQEPTQRRAVVGSLRPEGEVEALRDPFAEAPFYAAGENQKSEHITGLASGDVIAGIFRGLRQAKSENNPWYAKIETEGGEKIRLFTPRNLLGQLRDKESGDLRIPTGSYVELTYLGMEVVEGVNKGNPIHQFDVKVGKGLMN